MEFRGTTYQGPRIPIPAGKKRSSALAGCWGPRDGEINEVSDLVFLSNAGGQIFSEFRERVPVPDFCV